MNRFTTSTSALGRPLDPSYRSNVVAAGGAALTAILFAIYNAVSATALATSWWTAGIAVFIAWAIAREIDPDRPIAAAIAMPLAAIGAALASPSLLFAFGVLIGTRLIVGTVGLDLKFVDVLALIAIAALLGGSGVGLASVAALAVGVFLFPSERYNPRLLTTLIGLAAVIALGVSGASFGWDGPAGAAVVVVALTAAAVFLSVPASPVHSTTDIGGSPLDTSRVNIARLAAAGALMAALITHGPDGLIGGAVTVLAALGGTAISERLRKTTRDLVTVSEDS